MGRNVAEAAHRVLSSYSSDLPHSAVLVSPIGEDSFGELLRSNSQKMGMRADGLIRVPNARTAVCNMVLDSVGNLVGGVSDMDVIGSLEASKASCSVSLLPTLADYYTYSDHRNFGETPARDFSNGRKHVSADSEVACHVCLQEGHPQ